MKRKKNWEPINNTELISECPNWQKVRDNESSKKEEAKKEIKKLKARTPNQNTYMNAISSCTLTMCAGVAGTGKTFIACAMGAEYLMDAKVERIIITRPIVECGQKLGFLPGTLSEKTDPYMMPMFDSFKDFLNEEQFAKMLADKIIEIVPLEIMRGRTFHNCFIILDEAQNATKKQMRMFLTRFGENSKIVICGDATQSDLPHADGNPLLWIMDRLVHVDIASVLLGPEDIQRHGLIRYILERIGE